MRNKFKYISVIAMIIIAMTIYNYKYNYVTINNPVILDIEKGDSVKVISEKAQSLGIIHSDLTFRLITSLLGKDKNIVAGMYQFSGEYNLQSVIAKLSSGKYDIKPRIIVIFEGSDTDFIYTMVTKNLPYVDPNKLIKYLNDNVGYVFPDTYHFLPKADFDDFKNSVEANYKIKTQGLNLSKDDIILASILEGEANNDYDMRMVAGILKERMKKGMKLQVDAAPSTYKHYGLPDKAINNPGLMAINAVLNPIYSEYLYYITGDDGKMYYSKEYQKHKEYIRKYLK